MCLVAGPAARALDELDPADRRKQLQSWHLDESEGGGYLALTRPESTSELPFLHQPVGHIHWAGTETANDHPGYVDGAIESGLRVLSRSST